MSVPPPARIGDRLDGVDTPALLLDLDAFERNVGAVHAAVAAAGLRVRAHGKAHKCSAIGLRQIAAGAIGLCAQKVGEAEAFVAAGVRDVLVSNEVVGERKCERLAALAGDARVAVCVDDRLQVSQLESAARARRVCIDVLIEVDVGQGRCGVGSPGEALALAARIAQAGPFLRLRGLQAYHGRAQHLRQPSERAAAIAAASQKASAVRDALLAAGLPCEEVSGGGTGSLPNELASGLWTEVQPGSYALMDRDYGRNHPDAAAPRLEQALFGWCTVISARPGHAVLDGGLKAFAVDSGLPEVERADWQVRGLSDEHTVLAATNAQAEPLPVGARVRMIPGHCDPTVNLHDWIVAFRGDRVEAVWPVDARGRLF